MAEKPSARKHLLPQGSESSRVGDSSDRASVATKGSQENPLTLEDLPFDVPKTGRYWIVFQGRLTQLPRSPVGSTLSIGNRAGFPSEGGRHG